MARKCRQYQCLCCKFRWMVDVDHTGEYGSWALHGCLKPKRLKFSGVTLFGCADFVAE